MLVEILMSRIFLFLLLIKTEMKFLTLRKKSLPVINNQRPIAQRPKGKTTVLLKEYNKTK